MFGQTTTFSARQTPKESRERYTLPRTRLRARARRRSDLQIEVDDQMCSPVSSMQRARQSHSGERAVATRMRLRDGGRAESLALRVLVAVAGR